MGSVVSSWSLQVKAPNGKVMRTSPLRVVFLSPPTNGIPTVGSLDQDLAIGCEGTDSVELSSSLEDRNPLESLLGTVEHQFGAQGVS